MEMPAAFNEWMRRYTENPEAFEREWVAVTNFLKESNEGKTPSYGDTCATYLQELMSGKAA